VNSIPDNAFKLLKPRKDRDGDRDSDDFQNASPSEIVSDRKILLNLVNDIQKLMNSDKPRRALPLLRILIDTLKFMTFEDYTVANGSQLTQSQVLTDIENVIYKIEHAKNKPHPRQEGDK
jgi:hypothetical protein